MLSESLKKVYSILTGQIGPQGPAGKPGKLIMKVFILHCHDMWSLIRRNEINFKLTIIVLLLGNDHLTLLVGVRFLIKLT